MNFNFTKTKNAFTFLLTGMAGILAISSCGKSTSTPVTNIPYGLVSAVYAVPDGPPADFYINSSLVNSTALTAGNYVPYFKGLAASDKFSFFDTGGLTPIAVDSLTVKANQVYSIFVSNVAAKPDFTIAQDTIVQPVNNAAAIRLVNLSPDAPNVDLIIGGKVIVANKAYKQVSSFVTIPINTNDTLKIVQTGTSTVLGAVTAVTIQSNAVYTVWLYGLVNGTSAQSLKANLMQNALFN